MDYKTKPTTRSTLREYAVVFRQLFKVQLSGKIDVIWVLENVRNVLKIVDYRVVEDYELPFNVPAQCVILMDGTLEIQVKNSVYDGARKKEIGAYRDHILHEISHAFLYILGYTPVLQRSFKDGELSPYESAEWQAKALCGEIMMPYDETENMSWVDIKETYKVSKNQAKYRRYNY